MYACIYACMHISRYACRNVCMDVYIDLNMCEHLPVSRVVMYSISLLVCFACMYKACGSATYRIKGPLSHLSAYAV